MLSVRNQKEIFNVNLSGCRSSYVFNSITKPVSKILDVGCGYGGTSSLLTQKSNEVWGVDMDQHALEEATRNYPNVNFIYQSCSELPFPDNMFDVVILSDVIEHIGDENKQFAIDEIWRVLRPGGQFIFTAPYTGMLAWLDPLDFKRRFTTVYKFYMQLTGYQPQTSIEIGHKHISIEEVGKLFNDRFEIINLRFSGIITPFLLWIVIIGGSIRVFPKIFVDKLNSFTAWEGGVECPTFLAYNIRISGFKR
jgi:ubiquinone/menaquinone biosynthesis C-methylase UbiE